MTTISVILHDADFPEPITVEVDPLDTISTLQAYLPRKVSRLLIHQGCILNKAFTFAFFGIQHGAELYFIKCTSATKPCTSTKTRYLRNSSTLQKERSRLTDLYFSHIESKSHRRRRFLHKFEEFVADTQGHERDTGSIVNLGAIKPSTEGLPIFWKLGAETAQ